MHIPENFVFIIFGGSGDLTRRKLIPGLFSLYQGGYLPERFAVLGLGRKDFSDDSYRQMLAEYAAPSSPNDKSETEKFNNFVRHIYYHRFDMGQSRDYDQLVSRLDSLIQEKDLHKNYLYYLATPPEFFKKITQEMGQRGLQKEDTGWKRIILEKPFGCLPRRP